MLSFRLNYSGFPASCLRLELFVVVDICYMLAYSRKGDSVQLYHEFLIQPDACPVQPHLYPYFLGFTEYSSLLNCRVFSVLSSTCYGLVRNSCHI